MFSQLLGDSARAGEGQSQGEDLAGGPAWPRGRLWGHWGDRAEELGNTPLRAAPRARLSEPCEPALPACGAARRPAPSGTGRWELSGVRGAPGAPYELRAAGAPLVGLFLGPPVLETSPEDGGQVQPALGGREKRGQEGEKAAGCSCPLGPVGLGGPSTFAPRRAGGLLRGWAWAKGRAGLLCSSFEVKNRRWGDGSPLLTPDVLCDPPGRTKCD